jgi:hypothetical protein
MNTNRALQLKERSKLVIRVHDKALTVVAMRIGNKDPSSLAINGCNAAPTPTGFAETVCDCLPMLHSTRAKLDGRLLPFDYAIEFQITTLSRARVRVNVTPSSRT